MVHERSLILLLLVLLLAIAMPMLIACQPASVAEPTLAQPWRIGYMQGGDYYDYVVHLRALVDGLASQGLIEPLKQSSWRALDTTREMWAFLATQAVSEQLVFVPDAFWDAAWDDDLRGQLRQACVERISGAGDIDLMIAAGTWAGQDLATDDHACPVLVISASDPIRAGIIASAKDSGRDHVHAMCDPERYERNLRTFHRLVGFHRLGLVYEDTPDGRIYGNVEIYQQVARDLGFEIVERHIVETGRSLEESARDLKQIYAEMAPEIDALITTALNAEDPMFMPDILEPLLAAGIPTWGQIGAAQVRRGVLLSVAESNFDNVGMFYATTLVAIVHGAKPRDLPQVFEDPKALVLNAETARRIGYTIPPSLLSTADSVFETIEVAPLD